MGLHHNLLQKIIICCKKYDEVSQTIKHIPFYRAFMRSEAKIKYFQKRHGGHTPFFVFVEKQNVFRGMTP